MRFKMRMKKLLGSLIFVSCLLASSTFAAETQKPIPTWEIGGSTNGGFASTKSNYDGSKATNVFGIGALAGYFFDANWEAQAQLGYYNVSNDNGHTLTFSVGPTYNFGMNPEDAVYLGAQIGIDSFNGGGTNSTTTTRFQWEVHAGKRFSLMEHVTWSPEIEYAHVSDKTDTVGTTTTKTYGNQSWNFKIIQFTFLF
jgi:opacity protein-like surface antigen